MSVTFYNGYHTEQTSKTFPAQTGNITDNIQNLSVDSHLYIHSYVNSETGYACSLSSGIGLAIKCSHTKALSLSFCLTENGKTLNES